MEGSLPRPLSCVAVLAPVVCPVGALGPVVRGALRGFPLAVGHDPGGYSYLWIAIRAAVCGVHRREAMVAILFA